MSEQIQCICGAYFYGGAMCSECIGTVRRECIRAARLEGAHIVRDLWLRTISHWQPGLDMDLALAIPDDAQLQKLIEGEG